MVSNYENKEVRKNPKELQYKVEVLEASRNAFHLSSLQTGEQNKFAQS